MRRTVRPARPAIDCFYVYPTVTGQPGPSADLRVEDSERAVARLQASRFSQRCRIWAPMYRQLTLAGIGQAISGTPARALRAYGDVRDAWRDYLAHHNGGRRVVLIGHSQGSAMLTRLIRREIDGRPAVRRRLVSALILGGDVRVPVGRTVGGDFTHIPVCTSGRQTDCLVAYSSFGEPPPTSTIFGRSAAPLSRLFGPDRVKGRLRVVCANPARLATGRDALTPYVTGSVTVPWATYPGLYRAHCETRDDTTWLQVDQATASDPRPRLPASLEPSWGLHLWDVNLALGDLVSLVGRQSAAYRRRTS